MLAAHETSLDLEPIAIVGRSAGTRALLSMIDMLAASSSTVLITGESGTGKELVAQALHYRSPRRGGHFVPINCGAIPKELLESELFGHRKGAFTGALADRVGRFELAHKGTLFLDEVGDLPAEMQVKLLRVLEERTIVPLGSNKSIDVDVRVVAATHKNMEREVGDGRFREDLYYRLNVLPIYVPSLRERVEDVVELLEFYAQRHRDPEGRAVGFAPDLLSALEAYSWPGNVRELCNLVDRFSTFFPGQVLGLHQIPDWLLPSGLVRLKAERSPKMASAELGHLRVAALYDGLASTAPEAPQGASDGAHDDDPVVRGSLEGLLMLAQSIERERGAGPATTEGEREHAPAAASPNLPQRAGTSTDRPEGQSQAPASETEPIGQDVVELLRRDGLSLKDHLVEIERNYIIQALERTQWNVSKTARLLSLQRTTLIEKINRFGLNKSRRA